MCRLVLHTCPAEYTICCVVSNVPMSVEQLARNPPNQRAPHPIDQQKMIASIVRLPQVPGEEAKDYVRRRGREARKTRAEQGMWSKHWFGRAVSWDDHLARPRNFNSWPAQLRDYRGKEWLMERRASFAASASSRGSTASILAGRTGTRSARGKVHVRWHDGIDYARACGQP